MAFAFREKRNQNIGARDFFAPRRLHMNNGALQYALESGRRLGFFVIAIDDKAAEFVVQMFDQLGAQLPGSIFPARKTATASLSSVSASNRCSSVAYS